MIKTSSRFSPVLRRSIIRVRPDYFAMSGPERERYRLTLGKEDDFRIRQAVIRELFGLEVGTEKALDSVLDTFDDARYLALNSTLLPLQGIGENDFFLNECLADETTLRDFETVGDYARADHWFQEQARQQKDPGHDLCPYRGAIPGYWARLTIDGVFHYAGIHSQARYLTDILDERGFDRIDVLIPHEYIDGPNHGKREGTGYVYDKRIDAGGLEGPLEALRDRYYAYLEERDDHFLDQFDKAALGCVYMRDRSRKDDPQLDFVFSDATALEAVRFRHFIDDCRRIPGDNSELDERIGQESHAALEFLARTHRDIMDHFDPAIVKLRRRRKIILASDKLKDLL